MSTRIVRSKHPDTKVPLNLYPHQREAVDEMTEFLVRDSWGCLIHDAGLGKTATILSIWARMRADEPELRLVISCPACTLRAVWEEHIRVWLRTKRVSVLVIDKLKKLKDEDPREYDITIITRNLVAASYSKTWWWRDKSEVYYTSNGQRRERGAFQQEGRDPSFLFKSGPRPVMLVIDESHYLRNYGPKKVSIQAHHEMARHCDYGVLNTATPVCNRPEDVAGQLYSIALDIGGGTDTLKAMAYPKQWKVGKYQINQVAVEAFKANCHRRTEDILSLPELIIHPPRSYAIEGTLNLTRVRKYNEHLAEAREVRAQMKSDGEVDLESLRRMMNALTRMGQMLIHPKLESKGAAGLTDAWCDYIKDGPSPMLKECSKLVTELQQAGHKKLVVFGMHSNSAMRLVLERLAIDCPGDYDMYHGGLSQDARASVVKRFLAPNERLQVLFIQMVAGGVGFNLVPGPTAAIFIQQSWNPMDHLQAYKRIHRIGQDKPVHIYNIVGEKSPDAAMREIHEDKLVASDAVIGKTNLGDKAWRIKGRAVDMCEPIKTYRKLTGEILEFTWE